jgi:hypothetical protein
MMDENSMESMRIHDDWIIFANYDGLMMVKTSRTMMVPDGWVSPLD